MPSDPLAEFDLRGRSEPMLLRVEAEGHATLERRIDGASLPRFDEPPPSVPQFILLQD